MKQYLLKDQPLKDINRFDERVSEDMPFYG